MNRSHCRTRRGSHCSRRSCRRVALCGWCAAVGGGMYLVWSPGRAGSSARQRRRRRPGPSPSPPAGRINTAAALRAPSDRRPTTDDRRPTTAPHDRRRPLAPGWSLPALRRASLNDESGRNSANRYRYQSSTIVASETHFTLATTRQSSINLHSCGLFHKAFYIKFVVCSL